MGSHRLEIELGRASQLARSQRLCGVCGKGAREDERHFVFECEGCSQIRLRFPSLFGSAGIDVASGDSEVAAWMNPVGRDEAQIFWPAFARYLKECFEKRAAVLAQNNEV
jgi:hypothetical protein